MGSIIYRGKDRRGLDVWQLQISLPFDPETGTYPKYTERFHGPETNAKRRMRDLELEHEDGLVRREQARTLGDYLEQWLEMLPAKDVAARTRLEYKRQVKKYVIPLLGHKKLRTLTEDDVTGMLATLVKRGLKPESVLKVKTALGSALTDAVRAHHIPRNVTHGATSPKVRRRRFVVLSPDESEQLLAAIAADTYWHALVLTALTTGMRRGELLALRRTDVDLLGATISVVEGLDEGEELEVSDTKEGEVSQRLVRLHPRTVQCLAEYDLWLDERRRKYGSRWDDHDLVFPATKMWRYRGVEYRPGRYLMPHSVTQRWDKTRKTDIVPARMVFHDLRHTHATQLLRAGVNVKVVSERLGHADVSTTLDRYAHVLPDMQESAVTALEWLAPHG